MKETVTVGEKEIVLIGTAHVSRDSVAEVETAIQEEEPDTVAVELDEKRYRSLVNQEGWKEKDVGAALKEGNGHLLLFNLVLSIYQNRIGEGLGVDPGEEMLSAVETAEETGVDVALIDRDISDTMQSAMGSLSVWEKFKLLSMLIGSLIASQEISEEEVEELKQGDALTAMMEELGDSFPGLKKAFLDERDAYMASQLLDLPGEKIVAVVGAAHVDGVKRNLASGAAPPEQNTSTIDIPLVKLFKYGIPALIVGMFGYIFAFIGVEAGSRAFVVWFLLNGLFSGAAAIVARAHPVTVAAASVTSPFTSVNPAMPAGLVAAYVENRFNPPSVGDLEAIGGVTSFRHFWSNAALKLLLIFFLVNLGSSIASYIGAGYLAQVII